MRDRPRRRALVAAAVVVAATLLVVAAWRGLRAPAAPERLARDAAQRVTEAPPSSPPEGAVPGLPPPAAAPIEREDAESGDPLADAPNAWAAVDLDAVRAALPDNIYWRMSAPTSDVEVERARQEERARWNEAYGKVLSNTATEEEILAYYAHRDRLASDYVQFATYILEHYGEQLSIRDLGLLKVAVELNLARLEEIPRQIAEATERRKAHEAAREAWLKDQADFAGAPRAGR